MKRQKVIVFGTFDIVHDGHIHFLKEAKSFAQELVVVVARDKNVEKIKGKIPLNNEIERVSAIKNLGIADNVILGNESDFLEPIISEKPEIVVLGYDQEWNEKELEEKIVERGLTVEVKRAEAFRADKFKSSKIKKALKN